MIRRLGTALIAIALLVGSGCAVAIIGAAAAAGGAGYVWLNGVMYRDFQAGLADTTGAVKGALADLQFVVGKEKPDSGSVYIETKTADGHKVEIHLNVVSSSIPKEGSTTRVSVRVGFAGDDKVSAAILDAASAKLPGSTPLAPAVPPVVTGKPVETPPPPLAAKAR